jgi:hypothetical protein
MTTKVFSILFFVLFCISCSNKAKQQDVSVEVIDFYSFSLQENVFIPEEIVQDRKYIKLDDSDEALFKIISKIKLTTDRIYILDKQLRKLIVFNADGSFLSTVGAKGQGPGEYINLTDFDVDDSGNIWFIDGRLDKLFLFNSSFRFQKDMKLPFEADIIKCLPHDRLMFGLSSWNVGENSPSRIAITNTALETVSTCLTHSEYRDDVYWVSYYNFVSTENEILYNKQIDDHVYAFSPDGELKKIYRFDFGKRSVPDAYKKDIEPNMGRYASYTCLSDFVIITGDYCMGMLWDALQTKTFFMDRNAKRLYTCNSKTERSGLRDLAGYDNDNHRIISFLYHDNIQNADLLPDDIKEWLQKDGFAICLYQLK